MKLWTVLLITFLLLGSSFATEDDGTSSEDNQLADLEKEFERTQRKESANTNVQAQPKQQTDTVSPDKNNLDKTAVAENTEETKPAAADPSSSSNQVTPKTKTTPKKEPEVETKKKNKVNPAAAPVKKSSTKDTEAIDDADGINKIVLEPVDVELLNGIEWAIVVNVQELSEE
eukprot:TRINITY_DN1487_c0_g1_i1.p1 TRINITY_DN1487_c0_g1~~TRINITY_DN1487_c0_g1_i1.p1  ORF type:complete len:173 (-),score=63.26 TRINITY_DN1487_c0_g1_i1:128-646(-)